MKKDEIRRNKKKVVGAENSVGMKIVRATPFLAEILAGNGNYDYAMDAARHGMTIGEYVKKYRRDYGKSAEETYQIEACIFAECNLREWMKERITYVVKKSVAHGYTKNYIHERPVFEKLELPFPAMMIAMDLDDPRDDGHSIAYIVCKREGRYDVVTIADGIPYYFPINDDTMVSLSSKRMTEYAHDAYSLYFINLFWHAFLFLATYNCRPEVIKVKKVKLGVDSTDKRAEYVSGNKILEEKTVFTSSEKENIAGPGAAFVIDGLIPPDDRQVEIVMQNGSHRTPGRHAVVGHYRTYWTGKGRKIPIRKFIKSYERGGMPGDEIAPRTKIYEN